MTIGISDKGVDQLFVEDLTESRYCKCREQLLCHDLLKFILRSLFAGSFFEGHGVRDSERKSERERERERQREAVSEGEIPTDYDSHGREIEMLGLWWRCCGAVVALSWLCGGAVLARC